MARLLVVSRSMALAMRLADVHEVVEHPVEAIDQISPGPDVDVVVLDVGEPAAAIYALDRLRATGDTTPVLIVSGYQPAWAGLVAVDLPDVVVVPLPITRAALLDGVSDLAATRARPDVVVLPPEPPAPRLAFPELAFPDWAAAPAEAAAPPAPAEVELPAEQEQTVAGWLAPFATPASRSEPAAWAVRSAPSSAVIEADDEPEPQVEAQVETPVEAPANDRAGDRADEIDEAAADHADQPDRYERYGSDGYGLDAAPVYGADARSVAPPPLPALDGGLGWERLLAPSGASAADAAPAQPPSAGPLEAPPPLEQHLAPWLPVTEPAAPTPPPAPDTIAAFPPGPLHGSGAHASGEQPDAPSGHRRRGGGSLWSPPWLRRSHQPASPPVDPPAQDAAPEPEHGAAASLDTVLQPAPWAEAEPGLPVPEAIQPPSLIHPSTLVQPPPLPQPPALPLMSPPPPPAPVPESEATPEPESETSPEPESETSPPAEFETSPSAESAVTPAAAAEAAPPAGPPPLPPPLPPSTPGPQSSSDAPIRTIFEPPASIDEPSLFVPRSPFSPPSLFSPPEPPEPPTPVAETPAPALQPPPLHQPPLLPPPLPASPPSSETVTPSVEDAVRPEAEAEDAAGLARRDRTASSMSLAPSDTRSLILPFSSPEEQQTVAENGWAAQNFDWWSGLTGDSPSGGAPDSTSSSATTVEPATPDAEPVEEPPAEEPPGQSTLVEEPPAEEPPGQSTLVEEPPAEEPPGQSTLVEEPPAEEPAGEGAVVDGPVEAESDAAEPADDERVTDQSVFDRSDAAEPEAEAEPEASVAAAAGEPGAEELRPDDEPAAELGTTDEVVDEQPIAAPGDDGPALGRVDDPDDDSAPAVPEPQPASAPGWNDGGWVPVPPPVALEPEGNAAAAPPAPPTLPALPALPAPPVAPAASAGPTGPATAALTPLLSGLTQRIGDLFGVADTAQALAEEIVERADADAAAVLVPDGGMWRVSGGVGLRPLEQRLVLDGSHWLVSEIAIGGRALLVEDTDVVRSKLVGAPLAAWRHLLAVPIPEVNAAVVLARGQEAGPFSERELGAVVEPVREGALLLQTALQTRHLARLLAPLREVDPSH